MLKKLPLLSLGALLLTAAPALAHPGHDHVLSLQAGFLHPLNGIDHILAMVAVGIFAASLGGRALWMVPASFVGTMLLGGLLGYLGLPLPMVEPAIGVSVVAMGLLIVSGISLPTLAAMGLVALFAVFHGYAHGQEGLGLGTAFLPYALGFVAATASLHAAGIGLSLALDRLGRGQALLSKRALGALGVVAGLSLLFGAISA